MADHLQMRGKFVEKVTAANINLLLDGLLGDRVINFEEKDSVVEEYPKRADKARVLFDMVIKKGETASNKMMAHLERIDPNVHAQLNPPSGQSAQPATKAPSVTFTTVEEFWKSKQDETDVYPVTKASYRSRVALMITNIAFSDVSDRRGAEKDEENMQALLESLGYEVVKYTNRTGEQIKKALIDFTKHPKLTETDSVFVVIMSHGKIGTILGVNWKDGDEKPDEFPIDGIFKLLGPSSCPDLVNKPKIIIVQACRGDQKGFVLVSDATKQADDDVCRQPGAEVKFEEDDIKMVHKEKDFMPVLSCTPDSVSYRHPKDGSLLIKFIVETFKANSNQDHILDLFRKVLQRFEDPISKYCMQMATIDRFTLTRNFYLFPGLVDTNQ